MVPKSNEEIFRNSLVWLLTSYFFGYLTGAAFFTIVIFLHSFNANIIIDLLELYLIGLIFSSILFILITPIFLLLANIWLRMTKKRGGLDRSWSSLILFTLFIGMISALFFSLILNYLYGGANANLVPFVPAVAFFGGWFGTLLPRIIFKSLRPGYLA